MRSLLTLPLVLFVGLGCKETPPSPGTSGETASAASPKKSAAAATPKAPPRPQKELTVTVDGKPVEMVTAFALRTPEGGTTIELSSAPLTCADFSGNGRFLADGEVTFSVTFKPFLEKDGTVLMQPGGSYFDGMNAMTTTPGKLEGDGAEGKPTSAEIEIETESAGDKKQKLVAKGKIDAIGCPPPKSDRPALPPPTDLVLEIAGKRFPVRSAAIIEEPDRTSFSLYTGGEDCKGSGARGEAGFEVIFEKGKPWQIAIRGTMVPQALDQTFDKKKVTVKLPEKGPGEVELAVDTEVVGYPVKIKGKVAAQSCAR